MPELDQETLAREYGWAMSVLNSDPDLKRMFTTAVAEQWNAGKFAAEVRNTGWYKRFAEQQRQNIVLANVDPATYNSRQVQAKTTFYSIAGQMGANIAAGQADALAQQAFDMGWNEAQIRSVLGQYIDFSKGVGGTAGAAEDTLSEYAAQMGVKIDKQSLSNWSRQEAVTGGGAGVNVGKQIIKDLAVSQFPSLAARINAGETVDAIASPYKQSMANLLEIPAANIGLDDSQLRQALLSKDSKGQPGTKSLWQFENDLRNDSRWLKTKNAQDSTMSMTKKILTDFGLLGGS